MHEAPINLVLTVGEPAGIGPDIVIDISVLDLECVLTALVDPALLDQRAQEMGSALRCHNEVMGDTQAYTYFGKIRIADGYQLDAPVITGKLNADNGQYVYNSIQSAVSACVQGEYDAMVTAPVHKAIINEAGIPFSGHTELIAEVCGVKKPVMMLANDSLRVALVTTHLPLSAVASAVSCENISQVIKVVKTDLQQKFGLHNPRILVCGLNPHAGEDGPLGLEEIEIIIPCLQALKKMGIETTGPVPADTAFAPHMLENADIVIAMYHDQGLPVIKAQGFGEIVNITLGLPIIRTSVDHGTALDLAGSGKASAQSLLAALEKAKQMVMHLRRAA